MNRRPSTRVFFPWERRPGALGAPGFVARARLMAIVGALVALVLWIRSREQLLAGVRATRATITTLHGAVFTYRADHAGACPRELAELVTGGYCRDLPRDAWGHPLRLTCPGRRDPRGFEIASDGPDGVPGGLDRVE